MPSSIFRNFRSVRANFRPLFSLFPRHSFVFFNVTFQTWQTKNSIILLIREKKQEQPVNCAAPAQYSVTHSGLRCRHPGDTDLYGGDGAALPLPISPPGAHTDSPSSSCSSVRQWTGSPAASSGAESACDNRLAVGFAHPASAEQASPDAPAQAKRHCSSADAAGDSHTRRCASAAADPPDAQPDDPHCALPVRGAVPPSSQPHAVSSGTA